MVEVLGRYTFTHNTLRFRGGEGRVQVLSNFVLYKMEVSLINSINIKVSDFKI